jgi:broad specificity phosphatase PhoE
MYYTSVFFKKNLRMKVSFIRHGDARYENISHDASFVTQGDLKSDSIEKLRVQAQAFADKIHSDDLVTIWSSPIPRSVETANIFTEELRQKAIAIRKRKLFAVFEEAK